MPKNAAKTSKQSHLIFQQLAWTLIWSAFCFAIQETGSQLLSYLSSPQFFWLIAGTVGILILSLITLRSKIIEIKTLKIENDELLSDHLKLNPNYKADKEFGRHFDEFAEKADAELKS